MTFACNQTQYIEQTCSLRPKQHSMGESVFVVGEVCVGGQVWTDITMHAVGKFVKVNVQVVQHVCITSS